MYASHDPRSARRKNLFLLLQLRVLRLGLLQDGDVGVGVFPEREEILISGTSLGGVTGHGVGASQLEMGDGASHHVHDDTSMIQHLLKLGSGRATVARCQKSLPAYICWVERSCCL